MHRSHWLFWATHPLSFCHEDLKVFGCWESRIQFHNVFLVSCSPGSCTLSSQWGYQAGITGFSLRVSADFHWNHLFMYCIYPTNVHLPMLGTGNLFGTWPELGREVTRFKVLHWHPDAELPPASWPVVTLSSEPGSAAGPREHVSMTISVSNKSPSAGALIVTGVWYPM